MKLKISKIVTPERFSTISGKSLNPSLKCIHSLNGKLKTNPIDISNRWDEYIKELFDDERQGNEINPASDLSDPPITKDEVQHAMMKMKTGKSAGLDEVRRETLEALEEVGVEILHCLISKIYESGSTPKELLKSVSVTLPKKTRLLECSDNKTMSHESRS